LVSYIIAVIGIHALMNEPFQMHAYNLIFKEPPNQPRLNCLRCLVLNPRAVKGYIHVSIFQPISQAFLFYLVKDFLN